MGINIEKMKAKLEKAENKGKGGDNKYWKPTEGNHVIRFLPSLDGDPFKEYHLHYGLKPYGLLCPKRMKDEDCPICSFASNLYREGGEANEKQAKDLFASARFYSLILVRGEEDKGPQIYGYSKTVYTSLLGFVLDPDYGDITDPEGGHNIKIDYGKKGNDRFPSTIMLPRPKSSFLLEDGKGKYDEEGVRSLLADLPDMNNLFEMPSHEDLTAALDEYCAVESKDDTEGSTKYGDKAEAKTNSDTTSVDEAFKQLSE